MNLLILIFVALACCGVVVLIGAGMVLDARARRERTGRRRPDRDQPDQRAQP